MGLLSPPEETKQLCKFARIYNGEEPNAAQLFLDDQDRELLDRMIQRDVRGAVRLLHR